MPTFIAQYTSLDEIRNYVAQIARTGNLNNKAVYAVQLAVDEACTNIIDYSYGGESKKEIRVDCQITRDALEIRIEDSGKPFDISSVETSPDVSAPLSERQVGGLGIYLINNLMDDVQHQQAGKTGNILILKKKRDPYDEPLRTPDWLKLTELGERLPDVRALSAQSDRITQMVSVVMRGDVKLWLNESLFRLPDWEQEAIFPDEPETNWMREAIECGDSVQYQDADISVVAKPFKDHGFVLGVLQVSRESGAPFVKEELDALEGITSIAVLSLITAHRIAVEDWRIGQLKLVRQVSTQIATVMDIDELSRRVTQLIQQTFHYYYVAVFTVDIGSDVLRFRSSAGGTQDGSQADSPKLEIKVGEGLIGSVAQSGEEVICADVDAEPRYRFLAALPETKSEITLPLTVDERILGVLDIQHDKLNAFHPNDLLVLHALADSVALAIEGARIYNDLVRRAEQMDVIAEVNKKATWSLDLPKLMGDVAALLTERFGYPHVHLFSVHHNRRRINYEAGSGKHKDALSGYSLSLDDERGLIPWVARNKVSMLANDVSKEPRYRPSSLPPENTRSEIVVPLVFNGEARGILDVQSDRLDAFSKDDQLLFEALGDSIAVAIHNADLYRSERWRRQVADSLREVAGLLSDNVNLEKVFDAILTELERSLPCDVTSLWLLREEGDLYLAGVHGLDPLVLREARRASADASISLARALLSDEPLIRKPEDVMGPVGIAADYDVTYSSIAAPLHIGDQPVGVLTLSHGEPGRYGHEAQAITSTFASYAAVAIENARLYDSSQEQAYASAALLQVAQAVASKGELNEILEAIIRVMPILVGVDRCGLYLWDSYSQQYISSQEYGLSEDDKFLVWEDIYQPGEFPLLDDVRGANTMLLGRYGVGSSPISWLDVSLPENDIERLVNSEYDLLIAVPLKIQDDLYGILLAEEAPGGLRFRERRLEIINGIAQQAALSIQNDRFRQEMVARERLEHEVQVAREIQNTFIPDSLPEIPGWALAARWKTARQVGGDFYDLIELDNGRLGLFIADIADKGIPAALFMSLTRTLVRAAAKDVGHPAETLRRVNDLLIPDTQQGMFVTAVYGILSPETGEFLYANAGHNPPLWVKSNAGEMERLTRTGMALGVLEGTEMKERSIYLAPGDSLLLYTDGLTEAFSPAGELFGEERLSNILQSAEGTLDETLGTVENAVKKFMSTLPPADDLTMLAVRRIAP